MVWYIECSHTPYSLRVIHVRIETMNEEEGEEKKMNEIAALTSDYVVEASDLMIITFLCKICEYVDDLYKWRTFRRTGLHRARFHMWITTLRSYTIFIGAAST